MKFMFKLTVMLGIVTACSSTLMAKKKKISETPVGEDIAWLLEIDKKKFSSWAKILQNSFAHLVESGHACKGSQVACVYPDSVGTLFVMPLFYRLPRVERLSILIHEAHHQVFPQDEHISCPFDSRHSCDTNWESAYGDEIIFSFHLGAKLCQKPGEFCDQAKDLFQRIRPRVLVTGPLPERPSIMGAE